MTSPLMPPVLSVTADKPLVLPRDEVLRYMRCRAGDPRTDALADKGIASVLALVQPRACYARFPLTMAGDHLHLGFAETDSHALGRHLTGCDEVLVFAATIGSGVDRLLARLSVTSPAAAVAADAAATAAIEAWCDRLCTQWQADAHAAGRDTRTRFSAGYGDCPLALQTPLLAALDTPRRLGVTLTDSLLMTPTKSVTAIVGVAPLLQGGTDT